MDARLNILRALVGVAMALTISSCVGADEASPGTSGPYVGHETAEDFEISGTDGKSDQVSAVFNRNFIMSDAFLLDTASANADSVQLFLEHTPYEGRSWLADETVDGVRASDLIVEASDGSGINPIVMLARMQAEQGLISKGERPAQRVVDAAFGCGCHDGRSCLAQYVGLRAQVQCAADTMFNLYQDSLAGSGEWKKGTTKTSSDGYQVRPQNHATAAMYAYTPWVLPRRGGNWLVWNITKKYLSHFVEEGLYTPPEPSWVGTPCADAEACTFVADGAPGFCFEYEAHGFCSLPCEGTCPDLPGEAPTFCTSLGSGYGLCVSKSAPGNHSCADIPGTVETVVDRYVGSSDAALASATVCVPSQ